MENENQYDPNVHLSYSDIAVDKKGRLVRTRGRLYTMDVLICSPTTIGQIF